MKLFTNMTLVTMFQLIVGATLFSFKYKRRKYFHLWYVLGVIASFVAVYFLTGPLSGTTWKNFFFFTIEYAFSSLIIFASYRVSIIEAFFCGACGYVIQHFASNFSSLIGKYIDFSSVKKIWDGWLYRLIDNLIFYAPVYVASYFLVARKMKVSKMQTKYSILAMIFSIISILVCVGITRFARYTKTHALRETAINLYAMCCCVFIIIIQKNHNSLAEKERNEEVLRYMLEEERKQFQIKKEDIELINIKCHDMRKRLYAYGDRFSEDEIASLRKAIRIYDSIVKTGNNTLDVILSEKNLLCQSKRIDITCFGNASALDCLEEHEIYSLMENALDNAISAVSNIPEDKRHIAIHINSIGELVSIDINNYYEGDILLKDGLPVTSKEEEPGFHGFGILSMKRVAESHNGSIKVNVDNGIFTVSIHFFQK